MLGLLKFRIGIEPIYDPDKWGSIWIPDMAKERCDQGLVKYVGSGVPEDIQIGDHVLFSGYTGTLLNVEGEGHLIIMHYKFVIAKIEPLGFDVPGLYFRDKEGEYFPATYEHAMILISKAITEGAFPVRSSARAKIFHRPSPNEIGALDVAEEEADED